MESSLTFLERISHLLIFCMALSVYLIESNTMYSTITSLKSSLSNQQVLFEQSLEVIKEETIGYDEIIGSLMGEISYDLLINEVVIDKEVYNFQTFDFKNIKNTSYSKAYELDMGGNIVKIIYTELHTGE